MEIAEADSARARELRAEIALLKLEIEFKSHQLQRNGLPVPPAPRRNTGGITAKSLRVKTHAPQLYLVNEGTRTLMTPRAKLRLDQQIKKHAEVMKARRLKRRLEAEKLQWAQSLSRNATISDNCDRISIGERSFGVKNSAAWLVPIEGPQVPHEHQIEWNGRQYIGQPSGTLGASSIAPQKEQCRYFSRNGICGKGTRCPYPHDMARVALCRQYVAGRCEGECLLSHTANEFNTPICRYEFQDKCHNPRCQYSHKLPAHSKDPAYEIWTCRPFSIGSWCDRGGQCPFAHLYNCPDYEENGFCPRRKSCLLSHTPSIRIQARMALQVEQDGVVIPKEGTEKIIISSYTVEPSLLFRGPETYDFVVDGRDENLVLDFELTDESEMDME